MAKTYFKNELYSKKYSKNIFKKYSKRSGHVTDDVKSLFW